VAQNLGYWAKLLVYNTIVFPHFNYCSSLLLACNKEEINRLQLLQNRAMRVILGCDKHAPINLMLSSLGWLSITQSIEVSNIVIIFKIKNNLMPSYLNDYLVTRSERHLYNIRSGNDFDIQFARSTYLQKQLFGDGLRLYNALPAELKNVQSVKLFTNKLKMFYLNK